jgi:hypothetical protein
MMPIVYYAEKSAKIKKDDGLKAKVAPLLSILSEPLASLHEKATRLAPLMVDYGLAKGTVFKYKKLFPSEELALSALVLTCHHYLASEDADDETLSLIVYFDKNGRPVEANKAVPADFDISNLTPYSRDDGTEGWKLVTVDENFVKQIPASEHKFYSDLIDILDSHVKFILSIR